MNKAEQYIEGLKNAYCERGGREYWSAFESLKCGANSVDIEKLKEIYSDIPKSLLNLLEYVDGTYYKKYNENLLLLYFLGSDIEEYPYYLLSAEQMIQNQNAAKGYADLIDRDYDEVIVDDRITDKSSNAKWLHFSDCMNNGGTSQLFIDFTPSSVGRSGQIIRYLHDPDEIVVIADSFDDYLNLLMDNEYDFINEDDFDDEDELDE